MLDTKSVTELVEQQIAKAVTEQVAAVMSNGKWLNTIEEQITKHVQDRITAKFSNISTVPDLVSTVQSSVTKLFEQGHVPGLDSYVDANKISRAVDNSVQIFVESTIDNLVVDSTWLNKIENTVHKQMSLKLLQKISGIDLNKMLVNEIDNGITRWQDRLITNFKTSGIIDQSTKLELIVADDTVIVENNLISKNSRVEDTLTVQNLVVKGQINTDNNSWNELATKIASLTLELSNEEWKNQLVNQVLDIAKAGGIDFSEVTLNGKPLIAHNGINPTIIESNLQKVGTLRELDVLGKARIFDTLAVANKRVGINTDQPEMALSVWDEEVSLLSGKLSKNQAYFGTGRKQGLSIGVNRQSSIDIDPEGQTTIKKIRIDKHRIAFEPAVPGYSGSRGDIVFNSDPKPNTPFAWVCIGAFRWQSLKAGE